MYRRFALSTLCLVTCLLLWTHPAVAWTQVTLAWEPNTEPDLAGYRVFSRLEDEDYDYERPDWEGTDTTCSLDLMDAYAPYCFVVRAFDAEGFESADSNEACQEDTASSRWADDPLPENSNDSASGCLTEACQEDTASNPWADDPAAENSSGGASGCFIGSLL